MKTTNSNAIVWTVIGICVALAGYQPVARGDWSWADVTVDPEMAVTDSEYCYWTPGAGFVMEYPGEGITIRNAAWKLAGEYQPEDEYVVAVEFTLVSEGYDLAFYLTEGTFDYQNPMSTDADWMRVAFHNGWDDIVSVESRRSTDRVIHELLLNQGQPHADGTYRAEFGKSGNQLFAEVYEAVGETWQLIAQHTWSETMPDSSLTHLYIRAHGDHLWGAGEAIITKLAVRGAGCPEEIGPWYLTDHTMPAPKTLDYAQGQEKVWLQYYGDGPGTKVMWSYDPMSGFTALPEQLHGHGEPAIAVLEGKVCVVGGYTDFAEYYEPGVGWTQAPSLYTYGASAEALDGRVYVFGGYGSNATYSWAPGETDWTQEEDIPHGKGSMASTVVDGKIYVMGGLLSDSSDVGGVNYFRSYEVGVGWSELPPLPVPRGTAAAATIGSRIYLVGGRSGDSDTTDSRVFSYDTATGGPWVELAPGMLVAREMHALAAFDCSLYAIGGRDPGGSFDSVERTVLPEADCNENGVPDDVDIAEGYSLDCNGNGTPDECEPDTDGDGVIDECDNCPDNANADQMNFDGDDWGDACDGDIDNDGITNEEDACDFTPSGAAIVTDPGDPRYGTLPFGDLDGDCDCDLEDFSLMNHVFTGPGR
jgi:hypothetical protein